MSEHSLDELKRQWLAAEDAQKTAAQKAAAAKLRYKEAQFEATGFSGCIAETKDWRNKPVRFLPKKMGRWEHNPEIEGPIIKKDGTPGERTITAALSKAVNLGPCAPGAPHV